MCIISICSSKNCIKRKYYLNMNKNILLGFEVENYISDFNTHDVWIKNSYLYININQMH